MAVFVGAAASSGCVVLLLMDMGIISQRFDPLAGAFWWLTAATWLVIRWVEVLSAKMVGSAGQRADVERQAAPV